MNAMYYRMVNGYGYYPACSPLTAANTNGPGILGSGANGASLGGATPVAAAAAAAATVTGGTSLVPKWVVPNFSATQIQYMFRHRMDKGMRINKAVKCDTCNITLNSEQQAQQHYSGKNHLKKIKQAGKKKDGDSDKDSSSERRRGKDRNHRNRDKKSDDDKTADEKEEGEDETKDDNESSKSSEDKEDKSDGDSSDTDDDHDNSEDAKAEEDDTKHASESLDSEQLDNKIDDTASNISDDVNKEHIKHNDNENDLTLSEIEISQSHNSIQNENQCDEPNKGDENCAQCSLNNSETEKVSKIKNGSEIVENKVVDNTMQLEDSSGTNGLDASKFPSPKTVKPIPDSSKSPNGTQSVDTVSGSNSMTYSSSGKHVSKSNQASHKYNRDYSLSGRSCVPPSLSTAPSYSATSVFSPPQSLSCTSRTSLQESRPLKRSYPSSRGSIYTYANGLSNECPSVTSLVPHKKARTVSSTYMGHGGFGSMVNGLDVRSSNLMTSPHLALTPNSIPGYSVLQPQLRQISTDPVAPTAQPLTLLRPVIQPRTGATSMTSSLGSYGTPPQYGATYQPTLNPASYAALPYQALTPSDLASMQQPSLMNSYLSNLTPTAPRQTALLAPHQTSADTLTVDPQTYIPSEMLNSAYYQTSKDVMGQHLGVKYGSTVPTVPVSSGLSSGGYQYGTSIQAISIQTMGSDGMVFQGNTTSPYLSLSGEPGNKDSNADPWAKLYEITQGGTQPVAAPIAAAPVPALPAASTTRQMTMVQASPVDRTGEPMSSITARSVTGSVAGTLGEAGYHTGAIVGASTGSGALNGSSTGSISDPKLDPVAQAVVDNMMGKLPLKRKKEIHCGVCDQIFNSDAQANAHFAGTKHAKKRKCTSLKDEGIGDEATEKSWGLPFHCSLCNQSLNSVIQLEAHNTGQKHRNKMGMTTGSKALRSATTGAPPPHSRYGCNDVPGNKAGWFYCNLCDCSVPTAMGLQEHTRSEKHKASLKLQTNNDQNDNNGNVDDVGNDDNNGHGRNDDEEDDVDNDADDDNDAHDDEDDNVDDVGNDADDDNDAHDDEDKVDDAHDDNDDNDVHDDEDGDKLYERSMFG